jgi:chromosome transmission fidelity protein 8
MTRILHAGDVIKEIGTLNSKEAGDFELTIGYHQLQGKTVQLKKPLVILEKQNQGNGQTEYGPVGVIRSKILFKTRPTALISKPR